jgi:hypothetical protein
MTCTRHSSGDEPACAGFEISVARVISVAGVHHGVFRLKPVVIRESLQIGDVFELAFPE